MTKYRWLRLIAAVLIGEISLVIGTTIAQEVLFNGIRFTTSSWFTILVGGLATFLAAVGAGWVARWVAGTAQKVVPVVISLIIVTETSYLISRQLSGDPVWFDVLAGLSLVVGVWLGFYSVSPKKDKVEGIG